MARTREVRKRFVSLKSCSKNPLSKICQSLNWTRNSSISSHPESIWRGENSLWGSQFFLFSLIQYYYPLASRDGDTVAQPFTSSAVQAFGCTREDGVLCVLGLQLCRRPQTLSLSTGEGPPESGFLEKRYERYVHCTFCGNSERLQNTEKHIIDQSYWWNITQQLFIAVCHCVAVKDYFQSHPAAKKLAEWCETLSLPSPTMWNGEPMGYRTRGKMAVGAIREIPGCAVAIPLKRFLMWRLVLAVFWGCVVCKAHVLHTHTHTHGHWQLIFWWRDEYTMW